MSDESRRGRGRARARARPPGSDEDPSHRPPPPPGMQGRGVAPPPGFDRSFAPSSSNEHSSILSDADVYSSSFSASFASMTLREGGRSGGSSPLTVHGAPLSNTSTSSKGFGASPFAFKSEETEGDSSQTGSRGQPSSRGSGPAFGAPPPGLPVPRGFYSGVYLVRHPQLSENTHRNILRNVLFLSDGKISTTPTTLPPYKTVAMVFHNFRPISMTLVMEVTNGGIQLK